MSLEAVSLLVGILAVLGAGVWRCARLLFRIAVAVEAVPILVQTVQQHDHRITRIEAEMGLPT